MIPQFGANLLKMAQGAIGQGVKSAGDVYNQYIGNPVTNAVDGAIGSVVKPVQSTFNNLAQPFTYNQTFPINPLVKAQNLPASTPRPPVAQPTMAPQPTQSPQFGGTLTKQMLLNGINKWTANNSAPVPITQNLDAFVQAGNDFQAQGLDPYMPTIMSLRETQGGRDLVKDPQHTGTNNVFNIRNVRDAQGNIIGQPGNPKAFINYPSVETATVGGGGQGGYEGQILKSGIYGDYLKSKALTDYFNHYSPPGDGNGDIPTQVQNYEYMRRFFQ